MKKREASFTLLFRHWLKANPPMASCAFELKQTTTDSIPFDSVKIHQIEALLAAQSSGGILHKISDETRGFKPFDLFYLREAFAYVVIKYPEFFVIIDINDFMKAKRLSKKKSLSATLAQAIASICVPIGKKYKP